MRNLAFAGDEVGGYVAKATRTCGSFDGVYSSDEWLTRVKADVVFAFFGFNESFAGEEGPGEVQGGPGRISSRRRTRRTTTARARRASCSSRPSPRRNIPTRTSPTPEEQRESAALHRRHGRGARRRTASQFVDLFAPSQELFAEAARKERRSRINGVHLNEAGERRSRQQSTRRSSAMTRLPRTAGARKAPRGGEREER